MDSVLLYEDEKGSVTAKTYGGGTSWSYSIQSKISKAQKIHGLLNVFGAYDHTNNRMWTHSYRRKTIGEQFLDFVKRVDQKYDSTIKQIFLILDNAPIHKSNKVKQTIAKCHSPRIHLVVFLPTRSPDLNLIEVRWLCGCIQTGEDKQLYLSK